MFAIPGSIHSPQARGCHKLIKEGAKLVETARDILEELHWSAPIPSQSQTSETAEATAAGEDENERILSLLGHDPCGPDELLIRSGLSADALSVCLLHLELEGRIASLPGGHYQRVQNR